MVHTRFFRKVLYGIAGALLCSTCVLAEQELPPRPTQPPVWFCDLASIIEDEYAVQRLDIFLNEFYEDTNIEFQAVTVASLNGEEINSWTDRLFQTWKIGSRTGGQRGLLLVVAVKEKKVRLEVGYDLEPAITDQFVGYIENEQMKPFFEQGRIAVGIEATVELIVERIREKGAAIVSGRGEPVEFYSGGAGAQREVDIGTQPAQPKPALGKQAQEYRAQASPEATLALYLKASREHVKDPNLDIYTDQTKEFFQRWTVTNAQQDAEVQFEGIAGQTRTQDEYAVIFYPDRDWTYSPFFFRRSDHGWQLDFFTMSKVIQFNEHNYWRFVSRDHPYIFAFKEYQIDDNGFVWFRRTVTQRGFINLAFPWGRVPMEIRHVSRSSYAARQGIKEGDQITHVNGKDVKEIGFQAAVNECVGPVGTRVDIRVYRPSEKRSIDFSIVREAEKFD